jgi:transposase-like protein
MQHYKSADRRAWLRYYHENGNIAATCRHFGISRTTFYKWLRRYDPDKPSKPLLSKSRRRQTKPSKSWNNDDLNILAELDNQTGARLGAGRLAERLQKYDMHFSRATVGRMLARIRKRCPICRGANRHDIGGHLLHRDLLYWKRLRLEEHYRLGAHLIPPLQV